MSEENDAYTKTPAEIMADVDGGWYHFRATTQVYSAVYERLQRAGGYRVPRAVETDDGDAIPESEWEWIATKGTTVEAIDHPDAVLVVEGVALLAVFKSRITARYWVALQPALDAAQVVQISKAEFNRLKPDPDVV